MNTFLGVRSLRLSHALMGRNRIRGADTRPRCAHPRGRQSRRPWMWPSSHPPRPAAAVRGPYCASLRSACGLTLNACPPRLRAFRVLSAAGAALRWEDTYKLWYLFKFAHIIFIMVYWIVQHFCVTRHLKGKNIRNSNSTVTICSYFATILLFIKHWQVVTNMLQFGYRNVS